MIMSSRRLGTVLDLIDFASRYGSNGGRSSFAYFALHVSYHIQVNLF